MRAVFLDYETVSNGDLDPTAMLAAAPGMSFFASTAPAEATDRIRDAEVLVLNKFELTRSHIAAAQRLKLIVVAATGTDNVDVAAAAARGIAVCNVRGYCTASVAQQVWALVLSLTQHVHDYDRLARDGTWVRSETFAVLAHPIRELGGRVFGIVGWGELGRATAAIAQAFGMRVAIANRPGGARESGRHDLDDLLRMADVLSLHCPLTDATRGLIGSRELGLMKRDALLVNTARGGLVDGTALRDALVAGRLGGAGIDVLAQEPPADGDPLLDPAIPNLLLTPHVAWAAHEARQRCIDEVAANMLAFAAGGRRSRMV